MSGSISAAMPPPSQPSLPPQVIQALAQHMAGPGGPPGQGAMLPPGAMMPPPGAMPGPGGMPPPGASMAPPGPPQAGQMGAPPPTSPPPRMMPPGASPASGAQQNPHLAQAAQQIASRGRLGDSVLAHLTPGEVQVPPEVLQSNPQLMHLLMQAFHKMGVDISQFTAGSPHTTRNPFTGVEENSLWSALLPIAGAVVGSIIPGVGTVLGANLGAVAGGALGGAAGAAIDHTGPGGIALGALGGGVGGWAGAGGLNEVAGIGPAASSIGGAGATGAPSGSAGAEALAARIGAGDNPAGILAGTPGVGPAAATPTLGAQLGAAIKPGMWASGGATLAGMLAPPPPMTSGSSDPNFHKIPPGFNPNGSNGNGSMTPTFAGYNPFTSVTTPGGGYNFFPNGTPATAMQQTSIA